MSDRHLRTALELLFNHDEDMLDEEANELAAKIAAALAAEQEHCAKIVDCDCERYCERKELAEEIRAS